MFELFFNEPLSVWRDGRLRFDSPWPIELLLVALGVAAVVIFLTLPRGERALSWPRRLIIGCLQFIAVAAALLAVWRPSLEIEQTRPGENTVAWVVDESRSMDIQDVDGQTRRAVADDIVSREGLIDEDIFELDRYRVGRGLQRLGDAQDPSSSATTVGSAIADTLSDLVASVDERALAAVVLVSDGSDNQSRLSADWWQSLSAAGVPVHVVGLGSAEHGADVELVDVQLPASAAQDATIVAQVRLQHAPGSEPVRLTINSGDELLLAEDVVLDAESDETVYDARFTVARTGIRELSFTVSGNTGDPNPINDEQRRVIRIEDDRKRVLYVEGEPRWEYKFLRRALDGHAAVELVSLLRTSPNKFYRQGVRDADELADGFPARREDLFAYDAVIIGSLEAAQLTSQQQGNLRDFVNVRGGSLLMLGGREGLADGGWARSALAAALPVTLDARLDASTYLRERLGVLPTRQGLRSDWLNLGTDEREPDELSGASSTDPLQIWRDLPQLADHQSVGRVKPGALVLLESTDGRPVYVTQRYGLGTSQVLGTGGTWRWQMRLPSEDQRHEQFWRTLVTRLVDSSLQRIEVTPELAVVRDRESTEIRIVARNADYQPVAPADLQATLVDPDGRESVVVPVSDPVRPGSFRVSVPTAPTGVWSMRVSATDSAATLDGESGASIALADAAFGEAYWVTQSDVAEDFNTRQQRGFLERVATVTGGSYFTEDTIDSLSGIVGSSNAALTRQERLPLSYMPALFLVMLLTKLVEWALRLRWKRL